jgi:hypothetical protein
MSATITAKTITKSPSVKSELNPENHGSDKGRVYSENQQCRISCGGEVT